MSNGGEPVLLTPPHAPPPQLPLQTHLIDIVCTSSSDYICTASPSILESISPKAVQNPLPKFPTAYRYGLAT